MDRRFAKLVALLSGVALVALVAVPWTLAQTTPGPWQLVQDTDSGALFLVHDRRSHCLRRVVHGG